MQNRKIKVSIRVSKIKEVLEKLNKSSEFITVDLDIEENKDIYKYLSTSDDIISWDFIEKENTYNKNSSIQELKNKEVEEIRLEDPIHIDNYNELATYVESVWRVCIKSPIIKWGTDFFYKTLNDEYNMIALSPISLEHALLVMILQTYYRDVDITKAIEDTNDKLKNNWNSLKNHPSLASVSKALYE